MKILVAVKRVVDHNVRIRVRADGTGVETENVRMSMNPFDKHAVEAAVKLSEAGQADEIVITAAPDLANLRNAKNLVDVLEAGRPTARAPRLVVNMVKRPRRQDIALEDLSAALELEPDVIIDYDGETFGLAANNGQMLEECARKARAAQQLRTLAMTLAQRSEPKPEAARTSPLAPILYRLGLRA